MSEAVARSPWEHPACPTLGGGGTLLQTTDTPSFACRNPSLQHRELIPSGGNRQGRDFDESVIHSSNTLSTYSVPGLVVGTWNASVSNTKTPTPPHGADTLGRNGLQETARRPERVEQSEQAGEAVRGGGAGVW